MKANKQELLLIAQKILTKHGIKYTSHNNGYHFKIGNINFYPTTGVWKSDVIGGYEGFGINDLITHLKCVRNGQISDINILSVEQLIKIATKAKSQNLMSICEAIHKEIYND